MRAPKRPPQTRKAKRRLVPLPTLKKTLWEIIKRFIRQRDKAVCQACGAMGIVGSNAQTSHLIPSSICGGFLRYDQRNLYLCCMRCNIHLGGNLAELYRHVLLRKGQNFMDTLYEDKNKSVQLDRIFLMKKIDEYTYLLT